jgi:hypothetical protein
MGVRLTHPTSGKKNYRSSSSAPRWRSVNSISVDVDHHKKNSGSRTSTPRAPGRIVPSVKGRWGWLMAKTSSRKNYRSQVLSRSNSKRSFSHNSPLRRSDPPTKRSELHLPQRVKLQAPGRQKAECTADHRHDPEPAIPPPLSLLGLDAVVK